MSLAPHMSVLVIGATDGTMLSGLPTERLVVVQGQRPDFDRLVADGFAPKPALDGDEAGFDVAVVILPRARALAWHWIAQATAALAPGGLLVVDGARTDGIDSLYRACRGHLEDGDCLAKAHGRLFWGRPAVGAFADQAKDALSGAIIPDFQTGPGLFSADHVDPGSAALAAQLDGKLYGKVADLGAGWGYLTAEILKAPKVVTVHAVEADHAALEAARLNLSDPRVKFDWADATRWQGASGLDAVVMNPPFHIGRKPDPSLGRAFIATAARVLAPKGVLWMVANRHLPYEPCLESLFSETEERPGTAAFKILRASKPRR
ncbi:class I SAM-dependent methyltransferase [Pseudoruegeria sp. SK021]|uniref:class I SAM-dependent methyltransferase n=1 Tax=Pseudoruegeria sp. SK021 TaxID=1933035 RepID=UPI001F0A5E74|nr:class I SAM-dependent methyltransferase [Pseudoruegeria sp. SK021]